MASPFRLAIVTTHPIQYQVPWFRHVAARHDLTVFFALRQTERGQAEAGFDVAFSWDVPLLDGYEHRWLDNVAAAPTLKRFSGCDTPEIRRIIASEGFDAVVVMGWSYKTYMQAIRACWTEGVPILARGDSHLRTPRALWRRALKHVPYRWFLPRLSGHLYVGTRNREYLRRYGVRDDRLFFVPHVVDNAFFADAATRAETSGACAQIRRKLGVPDGALLFLFAGKLVPQKRVDDLVRACLRLFPTERGRKMHAVIVGDGPLRRELEQLAAPARGRIRFVGFRNQSEMPAWYRAADAVVLCSESETWGLAVNEAMACGRPAIVSDAAGCEPDLVDEGLTGFGCPARDVDALAERMAGMGQLVGEERVERALGEKMSKFSLGRATEGLEHALHRVTGRRPSLLKLAT